MPFAIDPRFAEVQNATAFKHPAMKKTGRARLIEVASNEAGDIGALNNGAKLLKSIFNLLAVFATYEPIKNAAKFFTGIGDAVKLLGLAKAPQDLQANKGNPRKVAAVALGIISSGGAVLKIADSIKLIELAKFAAALGKVSPALGKWLPIGNIFNIVDIAKAALDIVECAEKFNKARGVKKTALERKAKWEKAVLNDELKAQKIASLKKKIADGKVKRNDLNQDAKIKPLHDRVIETRAARATAEAKYKNTIRFGKLKAGFDLFKAKAAERNAVAALFQLEGQIQTVAANVARQKQEKASWKAFDPNKVDQKAYIQSKVTKWDLKADNARNDSIREALTIALNTVLIVALVASTVFAGLMLFGTIAASLPVSALFLAVSLIGLGIHFFKKYRPTESYNHVALGAFA